MSAQVPSLLSDSQLRPYLDDVRQWHGYMRFLGLPTMVDNPDTPLSELFVTPSLAYQRVDAESSASTWPEGLPVLGLLAVQRRLVLLGDPGCGKSTIVNWLAWLLAGGADAALPPELAGCLPLPMVARELKLDGVNSFDALLDSFLDRPVAERLRGQREAVLQRLAEGRVLLLVDGLDEVPERRRQALRDALREGAVRFPQALFLVTSRIVGYDGCALAEPPPEGLADDAHKLAFRRHLTTRGADDWTTTYVMPFDDSGIASFAAQWYALRSIRHIARHDTGLFLQAVHANSSIESLARMPQLLTLMALVFKVGTRLPDGRAILYRQIAEAYLRSIDEARRLEGAGDDSDWLEKQRWLARIGFEMQVLRGRSKAGREGSRELLAPRAKVLDWVRSAMKQSGYATDAAEADRYLDWVARRSGLLLPRGDGLFAFVHLSFQEYFAALHLVDHLADADWIMAQRDGKPFRQGDRRVTAAALQGWAKNLLWQEVLVFAAECFANQPRDAKRLGDWLFGVQLSDLAAGISASKAKRKQHVFDFKAADIEAARAELLTRLVLNPHSGWQPAERERGMKLMLRYVDEVERPFAGNFPWWRIPRAVTRRFVQQVPNADRFWQWVVQHDPAELDLATAGKVKLDQLPPLPTLQKLNIDSTDAESLPLLRKHFPGLQSLNLRQATGLKSLEWVQELDALRDLNIVESEVENLRPLASARQLCWLFLWDSRVSDLSPLVDLPSLTHLLLDGSPVSDLEPLRGCNGLRFLSLQRCPIGDLSPIQDLPLTELFIPAHLSIPARLKERAKRDELEIFEVD